MKTKYDERFIVGDRLAIPVESFRALESTTALTFPERLNGDYCSFIYTTPASPLHFTMACRKMAIKKITD